MRQLLITIFSILLISSSRAQSQENSTVIKSKDTILLANFWTDFKIALNTKDVAKLAILVKFPFGCVRCIIDTLNPHDKPYVMVTQNQFVTNQYQIFFNKRLIEMVNKYNMPKDVFIFTSHVNSITKKINYSFNYISQDETNAHPGRQEYLDLEKIDGKFKIRWIYPLP